MESQHQTMKDTSIINIASLPQNMTIAEVIKYLSSNELHMNKCVSIVYDPVISQDICNLPIELLCKIICYITESVIDRLLISKDIFKYMSMVEGKNHINEEITNREIINEIKQNKFVIARYDIKLKSETILYYNIKCANQQHNTTRLNLWSPYQPENAFYVDKSYLSVVDMFTAYNIRKRRNICMLYNPVYPNKCLVNSYNIWRNPIDIINVSEDNFKRCYIIISLLCQLNTKDRKFHDPGFHGGINELHIHTYNQYMEIIKNRIIELTGAIISQDDSTKLLLP